MTEPDNGRKKNVYMYVKLGHHAVQYKKKTVLGEITIKKNLKKRKIYLRVE